MDTLTIVMICFGALVFLYMVYGLLLPRKWEVKETALVDADQEKLFHYLNTIRNWEIWTTWNKEAKAGFKFSYEGPEAGEGATQSWTAKRRKGETQILGGEAPERIDFQFQFGKGQQKMKGSLLLQPEDGKTKVEWNMGGDAGDNISYKMMAKMMKPYMSRDLKEGLERLQKLATDWPSEA